MKKKQKGFIVSIELIFLATILVIGLLAGWVMLRDTTLGELQDVANAVGSINQSYTYNGTAENGDSDPNGPFGPEATYTMGSFFVDDTDTSDFAGIYVNYQPAAESDGLVGPGLP